MASFAKKIRLLRGILNGEEAKTGPAYVILDLSRRCNNRCIGCFSHAAQPLGPFPGDRSVTDIPFDLAERIGGQLRRLHTSEVVLLGDGEPLLHPRYFEIVTSLKKAGMKVQTFTNGILIDDAVARSMVENETEHTQCHLLGGYT